VLVSGHEFQYPVTEVSITLNVLIPTFGIHVISFMRATYLDNPSYLTYLPLRYLLTSKPIKNGTSHNAIFESILSILSPYVSVF